MAEDSVLPPTAIVPLNNINDDVGIGDSQEADKHVERSRSVLRYVPNAENSLPKDLKELHGPALEDTLSPVSSANASDGSRRGGRFGPLASYHRGVAVRMLTDYLSDLTTLNSREIDVTVQARLEEYQSFLNDLRDANEREPNSELTWQERNMLKRMLEDYRRAMEEALEEEEPDDYECQELVELIAKIDLVASGVPLYIPEVYSSDMSGAKHLESLTAALKECEAQVHQFSQLLPNVEIHTLQCNYLVETLTPAVATKIGKCRNILESHEKLDIDEGPSSTRQNILKGIAFCIESLFELARTCQSVVDLLKKCSSDMWCTTTAVELSDVRPQPLIPRWSTFSLTIRYCEWSMDIVELAFHALEKLFTDGTYALDDVKFKWSPEMCRMVLNIGGDLAGVPETHASGELAGMEVKATLGNPVLDVSKELETEDLSALVQKLGELPTTATSRYNLIRPGKQRTNAQSLAAFLKNKLEGPIPHAHYLPWTFRIEPPSALKFRAYLDKGSSGMVAKYSWWGETVAVKTVRDQGLNRHKFEAEAAILATVQHPNVVRLIGCAFEEKYQTGMLVMELMEHDLRTVIDTRGHNPEDSRFPPLVAIDIMLQIAEAMQYLREHRVLHRDLKAKNILVNKCKPYRPLHGEAKNLVRLPSLTIMHEYYVVKLADFGLAKCRPQCSWVSTRMAGTTGWRAPEVFHVLDTEVSKDYKWPADVYSFAMTCYEILTGCIPFDGYQNMRIQEAILAGERPDLGKPCLKDIPQALKDLINQCWATDPKERPQFAEICKSLWECKVQTILPTFRRHISRAPSRGTSVRRSDSTDRL